MKCNLAEDINQCPFYHREDKKCSKDGKCSFQLVEEKKSTNSYIRKERWYEKYYRR